MKCPGQDSRYWNGEAIFEAPCAQCAEPVEFFKDESHRTCRACGHRMANPRLDFGCAAYCPYADQCVGPVPGAQKEQPLKDRAAVAMKRYFGSDFRRIGHATRVARYAEEINQGEGGNSPVVLIASYLHDIGIKEAERKFNSTAARYQHQEGPPVARLILAELGAGPELIEEVCDIVGHHHSPRPEETTNFKVLYDADLIVNLEDNQGERRSPRAHLEKIVARSFLTDNGRRVAARVLLG